MILDWINFWSGITPDRVAITIAEDNQSYTYFNINLSSTRLASCLQKDYHLKKGDRICIIAQNCIEYIYLFSAAQKIGIVLVPLNYRLTKHELNHLIEDAQPQLILFEDKFETVLADAKNKYRTIGLNKVQEFISGSKEAYEPVLINADDPVFILYTSGSTGIPKGALYTHKMLFWNSVNTSISLHIHSDTSTLICMPPFHTGGWNVLLTPLLHHGGHSIIMKNFVASEVLHLLSKEACTQFMAVPTMLKMMQEEPTFMVADLRSLKYIIVGGEAMPIALIEAYVKKGIYIRQGFGMTEVGPNLTSLHQKDTLRKIGSIGKPNMYVKVKIINESGSEIKPGERGELCFSGPVVSPGYWNNDSATLGSIKNGWFHSGDVATQDEEGFLFIVDRIKNMYISGGENVYPAEVEKVLLSHPQINEVVIIGVPDDKWGEVGKAFLVVNGEEIDMHNLELFCRERLSKYKIPKHFNILKELPKNDTGKIDRRALGAL